MSAKTRAVRTAPMRRPAAAIPPAESLDLARRFFENAPDAVYVQVGGRFVYLNPAALSLFGADSADQLLGRPMMERFHPESRAVIGERVKSMAEACKNAPMLEEIYLKLDGSPVDVEVSAASFDWAGEKGVLVFVRDIGERKRFERASRESTERYAALFDRSFEFVYIHDLQGNFLDANAAALRRLALSLEDLRTLNIADLLLPGELVKAQEAVRNLLVTAGPEDLTELRLKLRNGEIIEIETKASILFKEGRPFAVQGIARDVTRRKHEEEQIRNSLKEKEALLREIHHRVKNNMQVISSLLSLQASTIEDPAFRALLKESQGRIRTMSMVHEKLYASRNLASVAFHEYVQSLAVHLFQFNRADSRQIELTLDLEPAELDIQTAIPCGLILNELITNALMHAYPTGRAGTLAVGLHREGEDAFLLTVRDDGIGLPAGVDIEKPKTFGLQIVALLVGQLNGTLEVGRQGGTEFSVRFKKPAPPVPL